MDATTTTPPTPPAERQFDTIGPQPGESRKERVDRELGEMLEEIRVALPGLELLFGFLLILPFSEGFSAITGGERAIYLACFLSTAAAAALLMAPTARHRIGFRRLDKEELVVAANRLVLVGLGLVVLSIALAMFLVVSVILDEVWAAALAGATAGWFALWWFIVPIVARRRDRVPGAE